MLKNSAVLLYLRTYIHTYICICIFNNNNNIDYHVCLHTAAPDQVTGVMVITNSITINDDTVTLTLSWGEPFNNFDPIMDYTVSCSGDISCPPDFTTTNSTTRSYTITNLNQMSNYTFSVVATNSVGSGEAGVMNFTTPSCE